MDRNLHTNPGAVSTEGFGFYSGGSGNAASMSTVGAEWSPSGSVARVTWTGVVSSEGDFNAFVGPIAGVGTVVTVVFRWVASRSGMVMGAPGAYDENVGYIATTARSRSSNLTTVAGEVVKDWATFAIPQWATANLQMYLGVIGKQAGDFVEMSMADAYVGEYQPDRGWVWGDLPDETRPDGYVRQYSWEGARNNSVSVRGDWELPAFFGWIATHTGLPSLRVTEPGPIYAGSRLLARAPDEGAIISDPLAPLGSPVEYRQGDHAVTLMRPDDGQHMVTDPTGRRAVRIALLGDDATDPDTGLSLFTPDTGGPSIPSWRCGVLDTTGTLEARTAGLDTATMLELVRARCPIIQLHSPRACQIPDCDIPPVRVILAQSARHARDGVVSRARREWSIPWTEYRGETGAAPVVTWGEYEAHSQGWTEESYEDLCRRIAGMP